MKCLSLNGAIYLRCGWHEYRSSCRRAWKIEYFRSFTVLNEIKADKPDAYILEQLGCAGYLQASSNISLLYSLFSFT